MIFTGSLEIGVRRLLVIILLLLLAFTIPVEARERHSENLAEIARREFEKRYAIAWWLNATGIAEEYPTVEIGNVTPSIATKIYEEIFNRKIELFVGGYQLKYLKLLMCGNDTVEPGDVLLLLTSFARSIFEAPSNEHRALLSKILFSAPNPAERGEHRFTVGDVDKLVSLVAELGEKSNVDKRYVVSLIVKLQLIKLATMTGIYEDAYNELLNELLMKESLLMAFIVDKAVGDLRVSIVKHDWGLQRQLGQVVKNAPLTRSDVLRVLNYAMEILQSIETNNVSIEELLSTVSTILGENVNVEYLEEMIRQLGSMVGENATGGTPLVGDRGEDRALLVESAEPSTGEDDVRMGMRKYNYSASTTEELENTYYYINSVISGNAYFIESLSKLLEKVNNEKIALYVEFRDIENTAVLGGERSKPVYIAQEKVESYYSQYALITLPLPLFLVAYKTGILTTIVNVLKEWATKKKLVIITSSSNAASKNEKVVFFERFWNTLYELSSKYDVTITKSTTHREAYALLSSKIKDSSKITVLEKLLYGYEYARYGGIELDVKPLLQLIDSLK